VRPHRTQEDRVIEGFEREVGIAQRLDHPNLVQLLRWTLAPPRPYLVFEFISAPTLGELLIDQDSLSIPETCLLGVRMLAAIAPRSIRSWSRTLNRSARSSTRLAR